VTSKDWLDVVRAIRAATLDARQPEPLPADAFGGFNAVLNVLLGGPSGPSGPPGAPSGDRGAGGNGGEPDVAADEWRPFDAEYGHTDDRIDQVFADFLGALRASAGGRPHVIALDHADRILEEAFDMHVYPRLIKPVADGRYEPVRFVLVAPEDWLKGRLPASDDLPGTALNLGDFESTQFMRLAREYCQRRGIDFDALGPLFTTLHGLHGSGPLPVTFFDQVMKTVPAAMQGGR